MFPITYTLKNNETLSVNHAHSDDAEAIIAYLNQTGGESNYLSFGPGEFHMSIEEERRYIAALQGSDNEMLLVGKIGEAIVSVASVSHPGRARYAHRGHFSISVGKAHWGKGIGPRMMEATLAWAASSSLHMLDLSVMAGNDRAISLYLCYGFEEHGRRPDSIYSDGHYCDDILMHKYIERETA